MAAAARMWKPKAAAVASVVSECQLKWKPIYLRSDVIRCSTKCFGRIWSWNLFLAHAEIGDFDVTILIQEDVVQLEIAINDAMSVKKEETNCNFRRVKPVKIGNLSLFQQGSFFAKVSKQQQATHTIRKSKKMARQNTFPIVYIKIHAILSIHSVLFFNPLPMNQFESQVYLWISLNQAEILRPF